MKTLNQQRDEKAKEYGLAVAIHRWERMPDHIDGSPREKPTRPETFTQSAYRSGFDAAVTLMQETHVEREKVQKLVDALKFYTDEKNFRKTVWADETRDGQCWTEEFELYELTEEQPDGVSSDFGLLASEALTDFEASTKEK